ncbi:MAG TPA: hypothetical protein DCF68_02665, partial [Cyanothece sp. UBA12306]|nr:hypothetical protein [Cyanothece sp. UBA12306]
MNLTNNDYLLLLPGLLSFLIFISLVIFKKYKLSITAKIAPLKKGVSYRLGRICLGIFSFCLTIFCASQLFKNIDSLSSFILSFTAVTSCQIFFWNLTY